MTNKAQKELLDSYAKTGSLISGILVGQNLFEIIHLQNLHESIYSY